METTSAPKIRPTFDDSFGHGWNTLQKYFLVLFLVVIILAVISSPGPSIKWSFNSHDFDWRHFDWNHFNFDQFLNWNTAAFGMLAVIAGIIALGYTLLIVPIFKYGGNLMFVHAARDIKPDFETLIKGFKENYLHIVLANLLTTALIMMGFFFLIIPGIIVACRLAFVSYLVMDKKRDPIVAVEESWKLTSGHGWTIFGMAIVSFLIYILGFIMCFVGLIPASIWVKSSFASLYEAVLIEKNGKEIAVE